MDERKISKGQRLTDEYGVGWRQIQTTGEKAEGFSFFPPALTFSITRVGTTLGCLACFRPIYIVSGYLFSGQSSRVTIGFLAEVPSP